MYAHLEIARMRHQQMVATAEQARHLRALPRRPGASRFRRRPAV